MAVNVGTAVAYLDLNMSAFNSSLQQAQSALQTFQNSTSTVGDKMMQVGGVISNVGTRLTQSVTVPLVNLGQSSLQYYADFESAITGIRKTVDDAEVANAFGLDPNKAEDVARAYDLLAEKIQNMATETGISAMELARVGEVSGQLGISVGKEGSNILKFIEVMAKLGVTTDLTSEDAALALARFINVADTTQGEVDRLGATIVDLGNNFATNEAEIVYMSQRLASAGTVAGLTAQEILALSTAISSAGIKTEAGASSMSTTLNNIEQIVQGTAENAEQKLQTLAQISGMSAEQFARTWNTKPIEAIQAFLVGLGNVNTEGESMIVFLDQLGMSSIRQGNLVRALALSSENLASAVDTANRAWNENTALETEWSKYASTTNQQLSRLSESWNEVKNEIGELLLPVLQKLVDILKELIGWWKQLNPETKQSIVHFLELASVVGPLLTIFGKLFTIFGFIKNLKFAIEMSNLLKVLSQLYFTSNGLVTPMGFLQQSLSGATTATSNLGGAAKLATGFMSNLGGILTKVGGVLSLVGGLFLSGHEAVKMWNEGCDVASGLTLALGLAIAAVGATLLGVPAAVAFGVAAVIGGIAYIVLKVHECSDDIKWWWENIAKPGLKGIGDKITNLGHDLGEGIKNWFNERIENAKDFVERVKQGAVRLAATFGEFANNLVEGGAKVVAKFREVADKISETTANVVGGIIAWGREVADTAREAIGTLVSVFVAGFEGFRQKVGEVLSNVMSTVIDLGLNLVNKGKEIGASFVGGMLDKLKDTKAFVKEMFETITGFIGEKMQDIFALGKSIAVALFDGIKEKVTEGIEWIKEKFQALSDWWNGLPVVKGAKNIWDNIKGLFDGSHKDGLAYVPFDGYVAQLHKGERVLTAEENQKYSSGSSGNSTTINFYSNEKIDEYTAAKELRRTMKDMQLGLV